VKKRRKIKREKSRNRENKKITFNSQFSSEYDGWTFTWEHGGQLAGIRKWVTDTWRNAVARRR